MTTELRKWAIEQAVLAKSKDVVKAAAEILSFVETDNQSRTQVTEEREFVQRDWAVKELTKEQQVILSAMIKRWNDELPINGVQVAKDLKLTQSCVSTHMRNLLKLGYIQRQGNKFWPIRTIKGAMLPVKVYKVPAGVAKGYKHTPMVVPLKEVARVSKSA